jgi:hypothetical protein
MEGNSYGRWKLELLEGMSRQLFARPRWRASCVQVRGRGQLGEVLALLGCPLEGAHSWAELQRTWLTALARLADDNELAIRRRLAIGRRCQLQRLIVGAMLELARL